MPDKIGHPDMQVSVGVENGRRGKLGSGYRGGREKNCAREKHFIAHIKIVTLTGFSRAHIVCYLAGSRLILFANCGGRTAVAPPMAGCPTNVYDPNRIRTGVESLKSSCPRPG